MAQHRITIDHKEYTMPKVSADDYMDYLDASETSSSSKRLSLRMGGIHAPHR